MICDVVYECGVDFGIGEGIVDIKSAALECGVVYKFSVESDVFNAFKEVDSSSVACFVVYEIAVECGVLWGFFVVYCSAVYCSGVMKSQVIMVLVDMSVKVIAPPLPFMSLDALSPHAMLLIKFPVKLLPSVVP